MDAFHFVIRAATLAMACAPVTLAAAPVLPDFSAATFVHGASVNNPYFPMLERRTRVFQGQREEDGELVTERFELTNLGPGPVILGVQTQIQRDLAFEDGLLQERTFDYFAQDAAGNVWYFGEDVTNFHYDDDGNLIGTDSASAWRAGVNGALPGFIMPADPVVGFNHYQEFAPGDAALDQARIIALDRQITVPVGSFSNVLQVLEATELDPEAREFKYYAPGIGLVLVEEGLDENFENPEFEVPLVRVIPEPLALPLVLLACCAVATAAAVHRRATWRETNPRPADDRRRLH